MHHELEARLYHHFTVGKQLRTAVLCKKDLFLFFWVTALSLWKSSPGEASCPTLFLCFPHSLHLEYIQSILQVLGQSGRADNTGLGIQFYFCSIALLVLSSILQISDETEYCFWSLFWLQSLWRCCLLCPISAALAGSDGPQRGFSSTTPTAPMGVAVRFLSSGLLSYRDLWQGLGICFVFCFVFLRPFNSDGFGEQLLGITKRP